MKETKETESPFKTFLKTLLSNPSKQKLYLEYFSAENGNKSYYLDTLTMVSQWEKPKSDIHTEVILMNGLEVNDKLMLWFKTTEGKISLLEH